MALKKKTDSRPLLTFKHAVQVEVRPVDFQLFAAVKHLDVAKLSKSARAKIELGFFETDCCRRVVRALVQQGMVVGLELEPCKDKAGKPPTADEQALIQAAIKRVRARRSRPFRPVELTRFLGNAVGLTIETITCTRICIFGICFVCCTTVDPDRVDCGKRIVVIS